MPALALRSLMVSRLRHHLLFPVVRLVLGAGLCRCCLWRKRSKGTGREEEAGGRGSRQGANWSLLVAGARTGIFGLPFA